MGNLSRIRNCPRVVLSMECPECGFRAPAAQFETMSGVSHREPYLEIGPIEKPDLCYRISLLYQPGAEMS